MGVLLTSHACAWCWRAEEGIGFPGTEVMDSCEPSRVTENRAQALLKNKCF